MALYIYMRFHKNISNGFQLSERTRVYSGNGYVQRAITPKSRQPRVTVHVFCTSSHGALHLCDVSWKYHKSSIEVGVWAHFSSGSHHITHRCSQPPSPGLPSRSHQINCEGSDVDNQLASTSRQQQGETTIAHPPPTFRIPMILGLPLEATKPTRALAHARRDLAATELESLGSVPTPTGFRV